MDEADKKIIATIFNSKGTNVAGRDVNIISNNIIVNNFLSHGDYFSIKTEFSQNIDEQNLVTSFESILKGGRDKLTSKVYVRKGYSKLHTENFLLALENLGKAREDIIESICDVFHICTACASNYDLADQLFPSAELLSTYSNNWDSHGKIRLEINLSKMYYLYGNNDKAVQTGMKAKSLLSNAPITQKQKLDLESTILTLLSEYDLNYLDLSVSTAESIYGKYSVESLSKLRCATCRCIGLGQFDKAEYYFSEYFSRREPTILKNLTINQTDKLISTDKGMLWNKIVKTFLTHRNNIVELKNNINSLATPEEIRKLKTNPVDLSFAYFILYHISDGDAREKYKLAAKQKIKEVKVQNHCTFNLNEFKRELNIL